MPIDPTTDLTTTSTTPVVGAEQTRQPSSFMGKEDFLKLLIGQLQNQDPLNPLDTTQSMAQMTQYAILEQLTNLNSTVSAQAANEYDHQAISLIGKTITYYDADLRDSVTGVVEAVRFTSHGPELTVSGRTGVLPVSILRVEETPAT